MEWKGILQMLKDSWFLYPNTRCSCVFTCQNMNRLTLWDNLHGLSEVCYRDVHGAVLINVPEEVPQAQFALIQIVLHTTR